jgi:hypothetical protein
MVFVRYRNLNRYVAMSAKDSTQRFGATEAQRKGIGHFQHRDHWRVVLQ